jgi:hypothetical protein
MIDEKLVYLARNAMLISGMEMGKDGDHWPVIKANIHAMMRDYEQLKIELAVREELREHVGTIIKKYEQFLTECDQDTRDQYAPHVQEMRDVYDAMYAPVDPKNEVRIPSESDEATGYEPWKSSAMIIDQLFVEENADGGK